MTAYELALFIHLLGVVTLFAGMALVEGAGARLRAADSVEHVLLWADVTRRAAPLFPVALLALLGGGLFMTATAWTFTTPWVVVAITGVVALGGVGGAVQGVRFAAIGRAAQAAERGPVPAELNKLIAAPTLWLSVLVPDLATLGILWTMAAKPGLAGAIGAVGGLAIIGAIAGSTVSTRRRRVSTPRPRPDGGGDPVTTTPSSDGLATAQRRTQ